ncbi:MAG TPA: N(4)-(beta-N-acetylglucosaminyl)-L-asparaginase [Chitinophagaceae bacterium]|nr:N(4)-(beta-N-acetylglucosaminyl)-L-asparaginase [Chitinophagaceae bacterium]
MQNRRKFLQTAAWGTAILSMNKSVLARIPSPGVSASAGPLVVSTWDFGVPANIAAWKILSQGGRALDAVEAGARVPEADPNNQSVGLGGLPDRDGHVTLDACIMDEHGNGGGVGCLEHIVHAVSVARAVMEKTPHVLLVGEGALQFALSQGFKKENLLTPKSRKDWKKWLKTSQYQPIINIENKLGGRDTANMPGGKHNHDTIGILALDSRGNLSGACTTSGLAFKMHGRVGDSPILGDGLYVDNEVGAATSTGLGEANMKIVGTSVVVEMMRQGHSPEEACRIAIERVIKKWPDWAKQIQLGYLAVNRHGETGAWCLQRGFNYAVYSNAIPNKLFDCKSSFETSIQ